MQSSTAQLIEQGKTFMETLRLAKAEDCFRKALHKDTRSAAALVWLGRLALMREQSAEGNRLLDEALAIEPNQPEAMALKATDCMQRGDFPEAIRFLEEALRSDTNCEMVYGNLARCYRRTGRLDDAEQAIRKAIELNPQNFSNHFELGRLLGETGRASESLSECLESIRINPLFQEGYLAVGLLFTIAAKLDEAIRVYREGLRHNPNAFLLREQICILLVQQGDFQGAMEEALEIIRRRNEYGDHLRLGIYALALGQHELAEKAFKKSVEMNPESWEGHFNLGELYGAANLMEEAEAEYKKSIEKGKDQWKPHNGIGLLVLRIRKDPEIARNYLQQALELSGRRPEPLFNLALASVEMHDYESAERYCSELLKITKPDFPLHQEATRLSEVIRTQKN